MSSYFKDCKNQDQVKQVYRALAKQFHPDHGGSTSLMQLLNAQYKQALQSVLNLKRVQSYNIYYRGRTVSVYA